MEEFKNLFMNFFKQLTEGCGHADCTNENCASNKDLQLNLDTNDAAAKALKLASNANAHSLLCENLGKTSKEEMSPQNEASSAKPQDTLMVEEESQQAAEESSIFEGKSAFEKLLIRAKDLTADRDDYGAQFLEHLQKALESFGSLNELFHETLIMDGFDLTPAEVESSNNDPQIQDKAGFYRLRNLVDEMFSDYRKECMTMIADLLGKYFTHAAAQRRFNVSVPPDFRVEVMVPIMLLRQIADVKYHDLVLGPLAILATHVDGYEQKLLPLYRGMNEETLTELLGNLQHFISMLLYRNSFPDAMDIERIHGVLKLIRTIYNANERIGGLIRYQEFYNDAVNNLVNLRNDFVRWRQKERFAFSYYPFILNAASKALVLQEEAKSTMMQNMRSAFVESMFRGHVQPFFSIRVRRDHLIADTLATIASVPADTFKRQMKVEFVGEAGLDAGGLRKEFFQLIVRELFDEKFGMFTLDSETRTYWFNPNSLESAREYQLIGILFGLAIYNSTILDAQLPPVAYKMLKGLRPKFCDLEVAMPELGHGLRALLEYDGDVESDIGSTFEVSLERYGEVHNVILRSGPDGQALPVTNENRQEFVDLVTDFYLVTSVRQQFEAFRKGFLQVADSESLKLFRWEELDLLVTGSTDLDFDKLEQHTEYQGFTKDHPTIKIFWEILHAMELEQKKSFLTFVTGSDRVPISGLAHLKLVIARNGPDTDRLPTSHTCFNVLLLPQYATKEKMREKLLKAIENSEGFGLQ